MKPLYLLPIVVLMIICPIFIYGQHAYRIHAFTYDASGNCIQKLKTIVLSQPKSKNLKAKTDSLSQEPSETDLLGLKKVTIYPNPTKGMLQITISGDYSSFVGLISLYDVNGKILYKASFTEQDYLLDMSSYANGNYILQLEIDNESQQWKIIKQE